MKRKNNKNNKRRFFISLTNFLLLVLIFSVLFTAKILMDMQEEQRALLKVSPLQITPEEDIRLAQEQGKEEPLKAAAPVESLYQEQTNEQLGKKEKAVRTGRKSRKESYSGGPYNDGGPLDLDRPEVREQYKASNIVFVPERAPGAANEKIYKYTAGRTDFTE